jgi:hypothetical protein
VAALPDDSVQDDRHRQPTADLEVDHIGVPAPCTSALLGERGQLDVVVDGHRTAQVLGQGFRDRQADQFRQRETGSQPAVRLDHTGQSHPDRTKSPGLDRALLRGGVDRAADRGDVGAPVPRQFRVAQPAAGQIADDGPRPPRAEVHAGDQPGLPGESERPRRPPRSGGRRAGGHDQAGLEKVVEDGVDRGSRQSGLRADHADGSRLVGVGQEPQAGDLVLRSLDLSGRSYTVHRSPLVMKPALLKTVTELTSGGQRKVQRCRTVRSTRVHVVVVSK